MACGIWFFAGVNVDTIPTGGWPYEPYTKEETVPKIQEKPYLVMMRTMDMALWFLKNEQNVREFRGRTELKVLFIA